MKLACVLLAVATANGGCTCKRDPHPTPDDDAQSIAVHKAPKDLFAKLPHLPPGTVTLSAGDPSSSGLERALERAYADRLPPCWRRQLATLDAHWMITPRADLPPVNAVHGKISRDAIEACLKEFFAGGVAKVTFERQGPITLATGSGGTTTYLGFSDDGYLVWDEDRAVVEEMTRLPAEPPTLPWLTALVARIDPPSDAAATFVTSSDLSGKLLGVRSQGLFGWIVEDRASPKNLAKSVPVTMVFDRPETAARALDAIHGFIDDASQPNVLRVALRNANVAQSGSDLRLEAVSLLNDPTVAPAAAQWLKKKVSPP